MRRIGQLAAEQRQSEHEQVPGTRAPTSRPHVPGVCTGVYEVDARLIARVRLASGNQVTAYVPAGHLPPQVDAPVLLHGGGTGADSPYTRHAIASDSPRTRYTAVADNPAARYVVTSDSPRARHTVA